MEKIVNLADYIKQHEPVAAVSYEFLRLLPAYQHAESRATSHLMDANGLALYAASALSSMISFGNEDMVQARFHAEQAHQHLNTALKIMAGKENLT